MANPVTIEIRKAYIGHRAHCGSCRYVSKQHADKRQAIKAAEAHVKLKHPGATVLFRGDL